MAFRGFFETDGNRYGRPPHPGCLTDGDNAAQRAYALTGRWDHRRYCAQSAPGHYRCCTRTPDHDGDHVSHYCTAEPHEATNNVLARWGPCREVVD